MLAISSSERTADDLGWYAKVHSSRESGVKVKQSLPHTKFILVLRDLSIRFMVSTEIPNEETLLA